MERLIDHRAAEGVFISLLQRAEKEGELYTWAVQVSDGKDAAEEEFEDEWKARAHYRAVCTNAGIQMGYQAPTFAVDVSVQPTDDMTAAQFYHEYRAWLQALAPGSDEVNSLRDRLMADPAFIRVASEVLALAASSDGWIGAVIRTTCRRIEAKLAAEAKAESDRLSSELEEYGQF